MKNKFPKKAKLITNAGFYKIVDLQGRVYSIHLPVLKRFTIQIADNVFDEAMHFEMVFEYSKIKGGYAEYRQVNFIRTQEDAVRELSAAITGETGKQKDKPKKWSRKFCCPSCGVRTGSNHKKTCTVNYKML